MKMKKGIRHLFVWMFAAVAALSMTMGTKTLATGGGNYGNYVFDQ